MVIYGLRVGDTESPIVNRDGSYLKVQGEVVYSVPTDAILEQVARKTGGAYVRSVPSNSDILALYRDEMREKLTAVENRVVQREQWRSGHQRPLLVGFLLFTTLATKLMS